MEEQSIINLDDYNVINNDIDNLHVSDSILKTKMILERTYGNILISISGGSDSDIILDLVERTRKGKKVIYVWFDTGLEFQATKDHLRYLEDKYKINIERIKAIKSVPTCCQLYGQPFLSKYVSKVINLLQRNNFKWENRTYEDLIKEYPQCKSAIKWWCNDYKTDGVPNRYSINRNRFLKEFMVSNPPKFFISHKCCNYTKKNVSTKYIKENDIKLNVTGIRQAEGGVRSQAYKNCFSEGSPGADHYRPIFWYDNKDKKYYEEKFKIVNSNCYLKYGFERTGCAGCPYSKYLFEDLEKIKMYEPNLYKACNKIFKESYEYTKGYREFCKSMKKIRGAANGK